MNRVIFSFSFSLLLFFSVPFITVGYSEENLSADPFIGQFSGTSDGDTYNLTMTRTKTGYTGTFLVDGETYIITGTKKGNRIAGVVHDGDDTYGFKLSLQKDGSLFYEDDEGDSLYVKRIRATVTTAKAVTDIKTYQAVAQTRTFFVNRVRLSDETVAALERRFGAKLRDGHFWYDKACGAWGVERGPTAGFIQSGLNLPGPMPADISGKGTYIFINGREIHRLDQRGLHSLFGVTIPGRYSLDARGNLSYENGPFIINIVAAIQQAQQRAGGQRGESVTHGYGKGGGARGTLSRGGMYSGRTASGKSVFWYPGK